MRAASPAGAAGRTMRLDGRQVGLNLFEAGQFHTCGYDFFCRRRTIFPTGSRLLLSVGDVDIDERAQAVVLAEVAARVLIAGCAIEVVFDRSQTDEARLPAVRPEPQCFLGSADRTGFTAMFVDNDLRLLALGTETGFD